jgi:hypothetical protein
MVANDLENGDLVELFSQYKISTHPLHLVYLRNEYATKKHKIVKEHILKWFDKNKHFLV